MIRAALGVVPRPDAIRAMGFDPAALTPDAVVRVAHAAMHFMAPSASECYIRLYLTSARWQWEAALREADAEPASIEALVAAWEPGVMTAIVIADVPDAAPRTGRLN